MKKKKPQPPSKKKKHDTHTKEKNKTITQTPKQTYTANIHSKHTQKMYPSPFYVLFYNFCLKITKTTLLCVYIIKCMHGIKRKPQSSFILGQGLYNFDHLQFQNFLFPAIRVLFQSNKDCVCTCVCMFVVSDILCQQQFNRQVTTKILLKMEYKYEYINYFILVTIEF